jgi:hypothetical protein
MAGSLAVVSRGCTGHGDPSVSRYRLLGRARRFSTVFQAYGLLRDWYAGSGRPATRLLVSSFVIMAREYLAGHAAARNVTLGREFSPGREVT